MPIKLTPEMVRAMRAAGSLAPKVVATAPAKAKVQARYSRPGDDGMTGLERQWGKELARRKLAGEIHDYQLHSIKLMIVAPVAKTEHSEGLKGSWYAPDFVVYEMDGTISMHETKGHLDRAGDGWLKFKAAASRYPFAFFLVQRIKGDWSITRHT